MTTRIPNTPKTPVQSPQKMSKSPNRQTPHKPVVRIGPYIMGKTLGTGSTSQVKLGTHFQTSETVAIKVIPKPKQTTDLQKKKLDREITIMKIIRHPNVLGLIDVYESDDELMLILEHVSGGELFDFIVSRGRLDESSALSFFQQIIHGVAFVHQHQICHRDLKPENLLLDKHLNIKIADFGMANCQTGDRMLETSCGSPHYASPEIIKGIQYDGNKSDVWSCGVILYALLTGNLPFDDENIRKLLAKVKSGIFTIPSYVNPQAQNLIRQMLTVDVGFRIKIENVMRHPWFTSRAPKNVQGLQEAHDRIMRVRGPMYQIEATLVDQLHLLGFDKETTLIALSSDRECMEKLIYKSLLDNDKKTLRKNIENGNHRLPESPKRRVQYQQDKIQQLELPDVMDIEISELPSLPMKRAPTLFHGQHMPLNNQNSSSTMNNTTPANIDDFVHIIPEPNAVIASEASSTTASPTKKYWFSTLFTVKHEAKQITFSQYPESQRIVQDILVNIGVKFLPSSTLKKSAIKCKIMNDDKSYCKFRIEFDDQSMFIMQVHGVNEMYEDIVKEIEQQIKCL